MTNPADEQQTRRGRRWWWAVLIVLLFVGAIPLAWILSRSALDKELAALRSQGLPTNAQELNTFYAVPEGITDSTAQWTAAVDAVRSAELKERIANIPIVGMGPTPIPARGNAWSEFEGSRLLLNDLHAEMELIQHAAEAGGMARYPEDFSNGVSETIDFVQPIRTITRLLSLKAHVDLHDGSESLVRQDIRNIFRCSDSLRRSPTLIPALVRVATFTTGCNLTVEMLPQVKWTDQELASLQGDIGTARFREDLLVALHGERALSLHAIDSTTGILFRGTNAMKTIELVERMTSGIEKSWSDAMQQQKLVEEELQSIASGGLVRRAKFMVVSLLSPAMNQILNSGMWAEANQNCAIAIIAAARYRLQHGIFPSDLNELADFIPGSDDERAGRLIDPFDGQPLRLRHENDRLLIYSIGSNGLDDGGAISEEQQRNGDVGFAISP